MDQNAVAEAVDEVGALLRLDGADLQLVTVDPRRARIDVRVELEGASCLECVLPPDMLADLVAGAIGKRIKGEYEIVVDDPRRTEDA